MSDHIKFIEILPDGKIKNPKTRKWRVVSKHDGAALGMIRWFSHWRRYAFYPAESTVFEEECLRDLATFCVNATYFHKENLKKLRKVKPIGDGTRLESERG